MKKILLALSVLLVFCIGVEAAPFGGVSGGIYSRPLPSTAGATNGQVLTITSNGVGIGWENGNAGTVTEINNGDPFSTIVNGTSAATLFINNGLILNGSIFASYFNGSSSTDLADTADILYETELDTEAELEVQLTDVTNVFTNNDGALTDDDLSDNDTDDLVEASNLYFTDERVDERVNGLLLEGSNITLTYNDASNGLTIAATDTNLSQEQVEDYVGGLVTNGANTTVTYDDVNGSLIIAASGGSGGDSISIDGSAVTDPDFVSTGDIDFVDTTNTITANINDNSITTGMIVNGTITSDDLSDTYLTAEVDGSTTNEIQNLFETMNAPAGTDPVADSSTDTLNFTVDNGLILTGDSSSDTLAFSIAQSVLQSAIDTNAATVCSGSTTYLDGENNCDDISSVYQPLVDNLTTLAANDGSSLTGVNAATIDSLDSLQFLRSDANDIYNGGYLALNGSIAFKAAVSNGDGGSAITVDWNQGNRQDITLTENAALSFVDLTDNGFASFVLFVHNSNGGSHSVTNLNGIALWAGGTEPTMNTTANGIDIFTFIFNGSTYYGQAGIDFK